MLVEKYDRQDDGSWTLHEYKNENDIFLITTIEMEIDVKTVYHSVIL